MKLYLNPLSGCSRRIQAFVAVHKIPVESILVDLSAGAHKAPDYLAVHPGGRVPALVDGDLKLWESLAILEYLAHEFATDALGANPRERVLVTQWSAWTLDHGGRAVALLNRALGLKRLFGQTPDSEETARCIAALDLELAFAKENMSGLFLAGDSPTVADFMLAGALESASSLSGYDLGACPMGAWYASLAALPEWPEPQALPARPVS